MDMKLFNEWLLGRPAIIQELANKYPPQYWYRVKEGAPYGISCPGTKVCLRSYYEGGTVGAVVLPEHKLPEAIIHEKLLAIQQGRPNIAEVHLQAIGVEIDPVWLERLEEDPNTTY